jgi:hypothetical protein
LVEVLTRAKAYFSDDNIYDVTAQRVLDAILDGLPEPTTATDPPTESTPKVPAKRRAK